MKAGDTWLVSENFTGQIDMKFQILTRGSLGEHTEKRCLVKTPPCKLRMCDA